MILNATVNAFIIWYSCYMYVVSYHINGSIEYPILIRLWLYDELQFSLTKVNFLIQKNITIFYKLIESFDFDANRVIQNVHGLLEENWENSHGGNTMKKKEKRRAHVHGTCINFIRIIYINKSRSFSAILLKFTGTV